MRGSREDANTVGLVGIVWGWRNWPFAYGHRSVLTFFTTWYNISSHQHSVSSLTQGTRRVRACTKQAECHMCTRNSRGLKNYAPHQGSSLVMIMEGRFCFLFFFPKRSPKPDFLGKCQIWKCWKPPQVVVDVDVVVVFLNTCGSTKKQLRARADPWEAPSPSEVIASPPNMGVLFSIFCLKVSLFFQHPHRKLEKHHPHPYKKANWMQINNFPKNPRRAKATN